jgi:hypothetical protein
MAEGYIYDETIGFVTEYMQEFKMSNALYGTHMKKKGFVVKC